MGSLPCIVFLIRTEFDAQSPADAKSLADNGHPKGPLDNPHIIYMELRLRYLISGTRPQ